MSTSPFTGAFLRSRRPQGTHPVARQFHDEPQPYGQPSGGPRPLLRQTSVHVHAANLMSLITSYRPHKNPRITIFLLIWLLGVLVAFFGSGPAALDAARQDRYALLHQQLMEASSRRAGILASQASVAMRVEEAKTTGWWLHAEQRAEVKCLQQEVDQLRVDAARELAAADALVKQQRQVMGLWSARGIESARSFFWQCFESGKLFARRQSLLDAVTQLFWMRAGERGSVVHVVQLFVMTVVNFTTGMLLTMFLFACRLPSYIASFGPSLLSGLGFFAVAMWGAASVVAAALVLMYSAGVGVALGATQLLLMAAQRQQRLQRGAPGAPSARALRAFRSFDSGLMLRSVSAVQRMEGSSFEYRPGTQS